MLPGGITDQHATEGQRSRELVPVHRPGQLPDAVLNIPSAGLEKLKDAPPREEPDVRRIQKTMRLVPELPLDKTLEDGEMLDVRDAGNQLAILRHEAPKGLQRLPWVIEVLKNVGTDHEVHRFRLKSESIQPLGFDVPLDTSINPGLSHAAEPCIQLHSRVAASRETLLDRKAGRTGGTADLQNMTRRRVDQVHDVAAGCVVVFDPGLCSQGGSGFHRNWEGVGSTPLLGALPQDLPSGLRLTLSMERGLMALDQGVSLGDPDEVASPLLVESAPWARFLFAAIESHLRQNRIRFRARISQARALSEP